MFKSKTLRDEETGLEAGLEVCKKLEDDLEDCLDIVERLNRKYNEGTVEGPLSVTSSPSSSSDLSGKAARSGQQLSSSYVDMHTKCTKLKRELDATVSLAKQISELAYHQRNYDYNTPEEGSSSAWSI